MSWTEATVLTLTPYQWQVTSSFEEVFIKLQHQTSDLPANYFTGTFAQAALDTNQQLFIYDPKIITATSDVEIFSFVKPDCFEKRCLAFKANPFPLIAPGRIWEWKIAISRFLTKPTAPKFVTGMNFWLDGSGLTDLSGNGNNLTPVGSNAPSKTTGLDKQPVLRWNGSGTQELQATPFLNQTTGATLYIVFTVSGNTNYNLVRTNSLDDYWHFQNGNGYIGSFLSSRCEGYPASMPSSGSHLVSIHTNSSCYEVLLDNVSKGLISGNLYNSGPLFRIGTNDKNFQGDIGTLLIYPFFIDTTSSAHAQNIQAFKNLYPSLLLS